MTSANLSLSLKLFSDASSFKWFLRGEKAVASVLIMYQLSGRLVCSRPPGQTAAIRWSAEPIKHRSSMVYDVRFILRLVSDAQLCIDEFKKRIAFKQGKLRQKEKMIIENDHYSLHSQTYLYRLHLWSALRPLMEEISSVCRRAFELEENEVTRRVM